MILLSGQLECAKFIGNLKAPVRAILVAKTQVRMNKFDVATKTVPNPFYEKVWKIQTSIVELNGEYEDKVNTQRLLECKDQDFVAGPLPWGEAVNNIVIVLRDHIYIKTNLIERMKDTTKYVTADGNMVALEFLTPFMPPVPKAKKQNLDEEVKVRSYMLDNILSMQIGNNVTYSPSLH